MVAKLKRMIDQRSAVELDYHDHLPDEYPFVQALVESGGQSESTRTALDDLFGLPPDKLGATRLNDLWNEWQVRRASPSKPLDCKDEE